MSTIAILGASGHIARGLIFKIAQESQHSLILYARTVTKIESFLEKHIPPTAHIASFNLDEFGSHPCDVVINAIGVGDPKTVRKLGRSIIDISAGYDEMVLSHLNKNPHTQYIFLSSGAVYGNRSEPRPHALPCPNFTPRPHSDYAQSKVIAEKAHRASPHLNIVDLRIFSYFSRFIDLKGQFLMAEIARCILDNQEFISGPGHLMRDYCVLDDLWRFIRICMNREVNDAFDIYSREPIDKITLLKFLEKKFGLRYSVLHGACIAPDNYYSSGNSESFLCKPELSSIEGIDKELTALLDLSKKITP